jgi:ribonuclease HI
VGQVFLRCLQRIGIFKPPPRFEIYTDGSQKNGLGAWAYVVVKDNVVIHEASGRVKHTDSNRMEFRAAVEALKWLSTPSEVVLYSDSRTLIDTLTQWRHTFKAAGWVKPREREIYNLDHIKVLDSLCEKHAITWRWVRAHSGVAHNERCDSLCTQTRMARG